MVNERGQRNMPGEHLYAQFFEHGHERLVNFIFNISDNTLIFILLLIERHSGYIDVLILFLRKFRFRSCLFILPVPDVFGINLFS